MTSKEELKREVEALRARSARLNAAILRISASLDLNTVLNEIVDTARALTGARYGAITTIDSAGGLEDFMASGFTPEELREMTEWPDGWRLFEHLSALTKPLRLPDFAAWAHSLGYSPERIPAKTLQATPMSHRGEPLGTFYLGDKEGGEAFTDEDEEVLVLFASQAATAIANARTHRDERRARADLEALVETTPVGVAVLDARTGKPVSVNSEVKRIVADLKTSGQPPGHLQQVMTCRFADGRELVLSEFALVAALSNARTTRAEEVELSVPDGRHVKVLINVTPIKSTDGVVESVVVTMQDLAPLEELERSRTEFLSMVSHELRAPLSSIKGSAASAQRTTRVLDPAEVRQFFRIIEAQADRMDDLISDLLDAGRIETGTLSVTPEPAHVSDLVDQARNTFLTGGGRRTLRIDIPPGLPRAMADEGRIVQVLNNLLSNAARHSPEGSTIGVGAVLEGVHVAISVTNEGPGLPPQMLARLFRKDTLAVGDGVEPGLRGSGLGLVICKGLVEAHGGRIRAENDGAGEGTRFTFTLPVAGDAGAHSDSGIAPARTGVRGNEPGQTRILVVDDDPETLRYVRDLLAAEGYAVLMTGDAEDLASLIRSNRPHLVLLDVILPGADGIELMERLPELTDVPVIFISGFGRDETIAKALEAGAADYIVKPFSPTELTARIRAVPAPPCRACLLRAGRPRHRLRTAAGDGRGPGRGSDRHGIRGAACAFPSARDGW